MTYDQLIRHYGGEGRGALTRAARKLKIPKPTLQAWKKRGIPRGRQFELRARSRGKLPVARGAVGG